MNSRFPKRLVLYAAAFAMLALSGGCNKRSGAGQSDFSQRAPGTPVIVTLRPAKVGPIQRTIPAIGTLFGEEDTTLYAKVPGRVIGIYKDIGDRAIPGELLMQLEKTDYELVVREKELAIRETLSKLNLTDFPPPDFQPGQVPIVRRAKLQAENARAKFNRGQMLRQQTPPMISDQDYADLETAADVADSNYEVERVNAGTLLAGAFSRKAELDSAKQRLLDTAVRVPPSRGSMLRSPSTAPATQPAEDVYAISARMVSIGEYVKEGTPLLRLVDDDPVKLRAVVPERFISEIAIGQKVRVTVESYQRDFWGQISRVNPQVDVASRNFQVEVIVPNSDHVLKAGSFAKAWIWTRVEQNVALAPADAISTFAGVTKVFCVRAGKASEIGVELGQRDGDFVEITKGLTGKEQLIVTGVNKLANGVPVVVK